MMDSVKSFSHVPLKKRPLQYIEDEQPEDLSFKKRKTDEQTYTIPSPPSSPDNNSNIPERFPHLADFYLRLFQTSALGQASLYHQSNQPESNGWFRQGESQLPINLHKSVKEFPRQETYIPPNAVHLMSPASEPEMPSPCSITSEDSGVCFSDEDENRHTCDKCGKTYSTSAGLLKHKQLHCPTISLKTFDCKQCTKSYSTVGALKMHIRTHTLPCKCHLCGKAFSRPWLLQGHIRTHTGEKPFQCKQCNRSFADRSNLRAHLQTHVQIKKYACTGCNKTFSRMSLLNKHTETACPSKNS